MKPASCGCHNPSHTHAPDPSARLDWARRLCREHRLRRTTARELVMDWLARQESPVTLAAVAAEKEIAAACDPATVFRILQKFEEIGLVRRIWLHDRAPYYVLLSPHDHRDYVLCTGCGKIEETALECPVQALEEAVAARLGYAGLHHELGFFGLCPECQGKPKPKAKREA